MAGGTYFAGAPYFFSTLRSDDVIPTERQKTNAKFNKSGSGRVLSTARIRSRYKSALLENSLE